MKFIPHYFHHARVPQWGHLNQECNSKVVIRKTKPNKQTKNQPKQSKKNKKKSPNKHPKTPKQTKIGLELMKLNNCWYSIDESQWLLIFLWVNLSDFAFFWNINQFLSFVWLSFSIISWVLPHRYSNSIQLKIFVNMETFKYYYLKQSASFWKDSASFWKNEQEPIFFGRIVNIKSQTRNNSNIICVITNTDHVKSYLKHE